MITNSYLMDAQNNTDRIIDAMGTLVLQDIEKEGIIWE